MTYPAHHGDVQISRAHNLAVRKEISERLGISLGQAPTGMPPHLVMLMNRLRDEPPDTEPIEYPVMDAGKAGFDAG